MSLLNDALRDLERRQTDGRPPESAVPAGLRKRNDNRQPRLAIAIGMVIAVISIGLFVLSGRIGSDDAAVPAPTQRAPGLDGETGSAMAQTSSESGLFKPAPGVTSNAVNLNASQGGASTAVSEIAVGPSVQPTRSDSREEVVSTSPSGDDKSLAMVRDGSGAASTSTEPAAAVKAAQKREAVDPMAPEPLSASGEKQGTRVSPEPKPALQAQKTPKQPENSRGNVKPARPAVAERAEVPGRSGAGAVKQSPQSASARDQRLMSELERMLVEGREEEAAVALEMAIAEGYSMPRSHGAMARYYLAQRRLDEARRWLPASLVASEIDLRLLRGRLVLLELGPKEALDYLIAKAPAAARAPDYIATLAALYQQTGQYIAAGEQWAALLETNSKQAEWWLGLALALDSQDQVKGAKIAYTEALALPDMSARLRAFAQSRLDGLH